ncbi:Caveolin [Dictyocaulus viviparus]|uniref:Caveolin n=1 Tax=Dictyocaulus viviparus TaxID=29172 RepID=A0A0D8Y427_DICVI|nr:Caveolin [Dictyocaulus viviparus]
MPDAKSRNTKRDTQMSFDLSSDVYKQVIGCQLNMSDRDQQKLNKDLQLNFLDIFGEPDPQYHSIACVWTMSYRIFELTRVYCYKLLTLLLSLPVAFIAGLIFAVFSFLRIWVLQPILVIVRVLLKQLLDVWPMFLIYIVRPLFYSVGAVFSTVRLHRSDGPIIKEIWETV